ncbi:RNA-binding S4 domain-containing protein [Thalassotalea euphylliae]|uniref:RNA-binding S4 domain-containing protein n=1 Tax=Thalassotalea euphylliae TaxID=1655234 RepID=UPI003635FDF2
MTAVYLVEIDEQPIELYKLLKLADLVSGGGEAKVMIAEGYVLLNNEVEFQKRKKVYDGDYIQFGDNIIEVQFVGDEQSNEKEQPSTEIAPEFEVNETIDAPTPRMREPGQNPHLKGNSKKSANNVAKSSNKKQPKKQSGNATKEGKRRPISF